MVSQQEYHCRVGRRGRQIRVPFGERITCSLKRVKILSSKIRWRAFGEQQDWEVSWLSKTVATSDAADAQRRIKVVGAKADETPTSGSACLRKCKTEHEPLVSPSCLSLDIAIVPLDVILSCPRDSVSI